MSVTVSPPAEAPYAAGIHAIELGDFGHSFRPTAPGPFTCPIDAEQLDALREIDEVRALLHAARGA